LKKIAPLLLLIVHCLTFAQEKYPTNYFKKPLDIPIILAGTFGEIRSNHFHAGIDIKTKQKEGLNILAAADGYISRIKVSIWGYGKVIYINHPNGFTTVYAHLSKFGEGIEEYVKKIQYEKENYETGNIFPKANEIPIKKGQLIAFSGSTGGFISPHLHFEVRDTKTEKILNPMLFGLTPEDSKSPSLHTLMAYPISSNARINNANNQMIVPIKKIGNNQFTADQVYASGTIGFGINTTDQLDDSNNHNGIYSLEMLVNGKQVYYHELATFSFAESKYINLLIDYPYYSKYQKRIQKTFKVDGNNLSIYKGLVENGKISIKQGLNYTVKIIAKDFMGNTSSINIPIIGKESNALFSKRKDTTNYKIVKSKFNKFSKENVRIAFPKNTFYEDFYLDFTIVNNVVKIHKPILPLNKNFTLTFNVSSYTSEEKKQLYIANINNEKYPRYQHTRKKDSVFYTTTKTLGNYTLLTDDKKPEIYNFDFKDNQWISNYKTIKVKISDNQSGIKTFRATIDNEWVLMEYDIKNQQLTYDLSDKELVGSKHVFSLEVLDNVGNTNSLSRTFNRK
jgi:hypothetical protein